MRQVKKSVAGIKQGSLDLTPKGLQKVADFLDTPKALHIEEIYFTNDGEYWLTCYEWQGKYYSRLDFEIIEFISNGNKRGKRIRVGNPKNLIVKVIAAQEIVDKVYEWREKCGKKTIIIDPDDIRNLSLDMPDHQKTRIEIWVEDEEKIAKQPKINPKFAEKVIKNLSKNEIINGK